MLESKINDWTDSLKFEILYSLCTAAAIIFNKG